MHYRVLNKYTSDHPIDEFSPETVHAINEILDEEFNARLVWCPSNEDDWDWWLIQGEED